MNDMRETMEKQPYQTPSIKKLGSVKEVTEGGGGTFPEGAGSAFSPAPPTQPSDWVN